MKWSISLAILVSLLLSAVTIAGVQSASDSITIPMYLVDASGQTKSIGTIRAEDGICGVLLTPDLHGLPPGVHGFHVHENPSCDNAAAAAGGHLDPAHTTMHRGPYTNQGHLGDLPVLIVDKD